MLNIVSFRQHQPQRKAYQMQVGDLVRRNTGSGHAEIGRILARDPVDPTVWLVTAGGRTYHDAENDLALLNNPSRDQADS